MTNGVNGSSGATPKTAADFKPEELQNAKQENVRNTIFELDQAITNDVAVMEADGEISGEPDATTGRSEVDRIYDWVHVIDNMLGNMSSQIKQSYSEGVQILKDWVANLIDMTGMGQYHGLNVEYDGETVTVNEPQEVASMEPEGTDADAAKEALKKRIFMREVARGYGCGPKENGYGGWGKLDSSNINEMYYKMLGNAILTPQEKVEIFTAWLDLWHSDISSQDMENWGKPKLRALMKSAEMHEFLDKAINDYINNENYGSSYLERHGKEYQAVMQKYGHSHNLNDDMQVGNPDYKKES